ncbi:MAG: alpha/beta hydrolase [Alcaligenaceae bacterium]|jgi:pimeloyl-ACP methyl ester carboxylesterase|nr:alpha/beta hydrolase [Alcaligenaceae bacterium]
MATPRLKAVMCSSPAGLHRMAYTEWGDPSNKKVVLCVHGLTRTGRDFDVLAKRLAQDYRVVCPDVVGRGMSDRLANPAFYAVPQYAADMVNLVDRLQPSELHWVGTSMGGLIGLAYAGALALARVQQQTLTPAQHYSSLPSTGVRLDRLVLNDVGPRLEPVSLERIGQYVGEAIEFASFDDAVQYVKKTAASFGPHTKAQWQELTRYTYIEQNGVWLKHYDLGLAVPFKSMTPALAAQGEQYLWSAYASVQTPILILRGAESDLLSKQTLQQMLERNPQARSHEFKGVGHAPTLMADDQVKVVTDFLYA